MTEQMKKILPTAVEIGSILVLTGIALKRNHDWYKAECKLIDIEMDLAATSVSCGIKDLKIKLLEKEIDELKKKDVKEEES